MKKNVLHTLPKKVSAIFSVLVVLPFSFAQLSVNGDSNSDTMLPPSGRCAKLFLYVFMYFKDKLI